MEKGRLGRGPFCLRVGAQVSMRMDSVQSSCIDRAYSPAIALAVSLIWLGLCAVLLAASPALAQTLSGPAEAVDGDTLIIAGTRIRLNAIDAPETDQTCLDAKGTPFACGILARDRLRAKIGKASVTCRGEGADRYGRTLARCTLHGEDLNRWLVAEGLALAYVQYSNQYVVAEAGARDARKGLWAGAFTAPSDWRHRTQTTPMLGALAYQADSLSTGTIDPQTPPVAACAIKGNVNRKGERIYVLPDTSTYGKVRMDKGLGERWFCSEEEAIAAGWRKVLNAR